MKEYAIRENHLYVKCYNKGQRYCTPLVGVFVLRDFAAKRLMKENPNKEFLNRIGFTATPKIGNAVNRNRCKRILRAAYRRIISEQNVKTGNLIVISARPDTPSSNSNEVYRDMLKAFRKTGLIENAV